MKWGYISGSMCNFNGVDIPATFYWIYQAISLRIIKDIISKNAYFWMIERKKFSRNRKQRLIYVEKQSTSKY